MSARRKKAERSSAPKQVVARLKKDYPDVYKKIAGAGKPAVPAKALQKLRKEARELADGISVVVPVQGKSFRARASLVWDDGDHIEVMIEELLPNTKGAPKNERTLVSILDEVTRNEDPHSIESDVEDDIRGSQEFKRFDKRCIRFCNELSNYEDRYDFDYEYDIWKVSKY